MKLLIPIAINCFLAVLVYVIDKHTSFKKMPFMAKQAIVGVLFGAVSAFASSCGVELLGTVVNVRDAAPLTAGLIFGGPSGVIAGLIGGLYRWFSVAWGGGVYTRLACTLGTILAGVMAAGLRKLMFESKKATWGYGICITVVCEVLHMLLILLTNMGDSAYAFQFVKGSSVPMIIGNSLAVGVSIILVSLLSHERLTRRKCTEQISQTFQRWLLACIVIAFLAASVFTYFLQSGIAQLETKDLFESAINDVQIGVRGKSDAYMLAVVERVAHRYEADPTASMADLAQQNGVMEINIVDEDGLIINSTDESVIGTFNMYSTEQSAAFMVLTQGEQTFVQEYGPVGNDPSTMRKYAGMALEAGGFIQIGYSTEQFHKMLNEFVIDVTQNRHVGSNGFLAVCDEDLHLVTHNEWDGEDISAIGIEPNEQMLKRESAKDLYHTDIANNVTGEVESYIYVFTFVEGYCIIAATPEMDAMLMRDASIYNSVFMQVVIFAVLFVAIYFLIKRVIINNLKKINDTLGQITNGNLNVTVDVRSNAEFASLSDDINSTVSTLKRYIAEAAARIDKELEYAKQIQLSALPAEFPDNEQYRVCAQMIAAKEVGGDFYDFYTIDDHTVAFLVADVSGKGIPAAMFMMTAKTIIKDLAERGMPVNEIFTRANEKLCESNESGMFVTAWMGILDLDTGKLQFANAGHNPPLIKRGNGEFSYLKSRAGFVLAGMEGIRYRVNEMELGPGDRIFLYTDGVTEATDTQNCLYGEERLLSFMNGHADALAADLLPLLKEDIDAFAGEAPQFDDITMLMFDYQPQIGGVTMTRRIFPAQVDALNDVLGFVEEMLETCNCPMKTVMALCVAIEEVFVNIANYAYGDGEGEVTFDIGFDSNTGTVTFRMADKGIPFDPLKKPDPDITLSAEEREIGGLGIFITKKTMDSVVYSYENNENIMTMTKTI